MGVALDRAEAEKRKVRSARACSRFSVFSFAKRWLDPHGLRQIYLSDRRSGKCSFDSRIVWDVFHTPSKNANAGRLECSVLFCVSNLLPFFFMRDP
jgi:hypothetical protein